MVTGGTGFVGMRLVEMLVERGAESVLSFDIVPAPEAAWRHPAIRWVVGDITDRGAVVDACEGVDCVFHIAAAVGPYHPYELYRKVNYEGTLNVLAGCKEHRVPKLVMSSSPSTRFVGTDVDGITEDDLPPLPLKSYLQAYAETKAEAEMAVTRECCDSLLTIAVAPHQVYGPRDNLFMPNILESCGTGKLRVFGRGDNRICFTHVDNYCHGLILGGRALYRGSPALGQFYVVTDAETHPDPRGFALFWDVLDSATDVFGFSRIKSRTALPTWLIWTLATLCDLFTLVTGLKLKLSTFTVRMLTMHRWFNTQKAERDLGYKPIIGFSEGWADNLEWFRVNWLPDFHRSRCKKQGNIGIAKQSEEKINIQKEAVSSLKGRQ